MEADTVTPQNTMDMRWDLLNSQRPSDNRLTARLAMPARSDSVFIAVDAASHRYVLVQVPDGEPCSVVEQASRGIAVQTVEMKLDDSGKSKIFIEIACLDSSGYAALDIVTAELIAAITAGASIGRVRLVQNILAKWRRFWSGISQNLLSREQYIGLFGELWFLSRWLIPSLGADQAIAMWRGPVGARNDFEQNCWAIEVKTSGKLDGTHLINGLEQLLEPECGELYFFSLLVRDEASGIESLPKMIKEIRESLGSEYAALIKFEAMLAASGYDDVFATEYEKTKLRVRGQGLYRVIDGFPRLVPSLISPNVPLGVGKVTYELRLDGAEQYSVGNDPLACSQLLQGLASKYLATTD